MSRKRLPLVAVATVALIGAGGSYGVAANGNAESKASSSAPGDAAVEGVRTVKRTSPAPASLRHESSMQRWTGERSQKNC